MVHQDQEKELGMGWKFPPSFNLHKHTVDMSEGREGVKQSLMILMRTRIGERTMEPSYGCDLSPVAFEQMDLNLETAMVNNIKQAIKMNEPRVEVEEVELMPNHNEGSIEIHLVYTIKGYSEKEKLQYRYHPIYNK